MGQPVTESSTLLNAQIGFLDTHLALIHIPTDAYPLFVQPILSLLLHNELSNQADTHDSRPRRPWQHWQPFVNVSLTPKECSIVCPRDLARALFVPLRDGLSKSFQQAVSISEEDYSVIMIGGEGLEAGQRVLDLTSPLAMAGIPIFFITSYYSDFILVPLSSRQKVINALQERGFVFEATDEDGETGKMTNPASPLFHPRQRQDSISSSSFDYLPATPPPASISELQEKTFRLLNRNYIKPHVDDSIELVTCAGIKDSTTSNSSSHFTEGKLQLGIARCLTSTPPPQFFSVTLTDSESTSLTLETRLLHFFPNDGGDVLLGTQSPEQISITLDLHNLPLESTGIVCGVASKLTEGMKGRIGRDMFNMSYLSTARAGHVIVYQDELEDALDALKGA